MFCYWQCFCVVLCTVSLISMDFQVLYVSFARVGSGCLCEGVCFILFAFRLEVSKVFIGEIYHVYEVIAVFPV